MAHFVRTLGRDQKALSNVTICANQEGFALEFVLVSPLKTSNGKRSREFDPNHFLATIGEGRKTVAVGKKEGIFSQGDDANAVFYIQSGKVKLTVVSKTGR